MSIFIKGLNVPDKYPVKVIINPTGEAFVDYGPYFETLEAVNVPAPHGRLIDADRLYKNYQEICSDIACTTCPFLNEDGCEVEQMIMYASTIIEAEKGEGE